MKKAIIWTLTLSLVFCLFGGAAYASGEPSGSGEASSAEPAEVTEEIFDVGCGEPFSDTPAPGVVDGERYVSDALRGASAIYVSGGEYTFDDVYVYGAGTSTEDDLSAERSNQYGYCSDVLVVSSASDVVLNNPTIVSDPESYANGVFAAALAKVTVNGGAIYTNNAQGHGIDVTYMGHVYAYDTVIHTGGSASGALASDYGGGFITAEGLDCTTELAGSPGIYCAGSSIIMCRDCTFRANNCEGVMSAHDHGVTVLENCDIFGGPCALNGHQAMPSAAQSTGSYCFIFGGTLTSGSGPVVRENNGRTETTLVGVECARGEGCDNAIEADDEAEGILTVNLWDTELEGDIYSGAGASVTVNIYDGGKLTGDVTGDGEVVINVYDGGEYVGNGAAVKAGPGGEKPVCGDFDYYLVNYWAAGMQKWQSGTITTFVDEVEPIIVGNSAAAFVEEGAASIAYDPATTDVSEGGIDLNSLDTTSAYGFGDPGSSAASGEASGEAS